MGLARLPDLFRFGLGLGSKGFESGFPTAPKKNLIRLSPLDYTGLRGEGSIPVPLPPPASAALLPITAFDWGSGCH